MDWWINYIDLTGCGRFVEGNQFTTTLFILTDLCHHGYKIVSTNVQKCMFGDTNHF